MKEINRGVYPVMLTPYNKAGDVDYGALKELVDYYWRKGCHGIFAACQSSEIFHLSLKDRVGISKATKEEADRLAAADKSRAPMSIVASGHISDDFEEQVAELTAVYETGVDAVVTISNRFDIANTCEDKWIADAQRLINRLPSDILLGTYECPYPYKRLLTDKIINFMGDVGRFAFIKDTCCDMNMITRRIQLGGKKGVGLFNANGQTILDSLKAGAKGYSGIMANFHPELYVWLCENYEKQPALAEKVADFLCMCAFTENPAYPNTAKYGLQVFEGLPMEISSRQSSLNLLTDYQKRWVARMHRAANELYSSLTK